jgi:hypothetical protein
MEGHGGCLPRDMLLSNLAAGSIAPMALLRIVHHFNQVQPFLVCPFSRSPAMYTARTQCFPLELACPLSMTLAV